MEINGKALVDLKDEKTGQVVKAGQQLPGFAWLKDDGTTMCGNWVAAALIGSALVALAGLLYIALEITTNWEQARSPGEKSFGVAVLGMMLGIPMLFCAGAGVLSFAIGPFAAAFNRLRGARNAASTRNLR